MTPDDGEDRDFRRLGFRRAPGLDRSRAERFERLIEAAREEWRARTRPLTEERIRRLAEREDRAREELERARERGARIDPETGSVSLPPDLD